SYVGSSAPCTKFTNPCSGTSTPVGIKRGMLYTPTALLSRGCRQTPVSCALQLLYVQPARFAPSTAGGLLNLARRRTPCVHHLQGTEHVAYASWQHLQDHPRPPSGTVDAFL